MTTTAKDIAENLTASLKENLAAAPAPAETPADTQSNAPDTSSSAAPVEAAQAPETTAPEKPEAVTPADAAPATPSPVPTAAAPEQENLAESALKIASDFGGDLNKAVVELRKRLSVKGESESRLQKELEALRASPKPPEAAVAPTATGTPTQPATPPATAATPSAVTDPVDTEVRALLEQDHEVAPALEALRTKAEQLNALDSVDPRTRQRVGVIPELLEEIRDLRAWLPENAKKRGLPELDEMSLEKLQRDLGAKEGQLERLLMAQARLTNEKDTLYAGLSNRRDYYKAQVLKQREEEAERKAEEERLTQRAQEYKSTWNTAFDLELKALNISDEDTKGRIHDRVFDAIDRAVARRDRNVATPEDLALLVEAHDKLPDIIKRHAKAELDYQDKVRRSAARANAEAKAAQVAPQAPPGSAAVASSPAVADPNDPDAWKDNLKSAYRASRGQPAA